MNSLYRRKPLGPTVIHWRARRGLATVALLVPLAVAVAGVLAVGRWRASAGDQVLALDAASHRLQAGAEHLQTHLAWRHRLPCAAAQPNGAEQCPRAKGWFPALTVMGPAAAASATPMRYVVDPALTAPADVARLGEVAAVNQLDVCRLLAVDGNQWLQPSPPATIDASMPQTRDAAGTPVNIAFGLAASTDMSLFFADRNADDSLEIEPPSRPVGPGYRNLTSATDRATLFIALGCASALATVSSAERVVPIGGLALGQKAGMKKGTEYFAPLMALGTTASLSAFASSLGSIENQTDVTAQSLAYLAACLGLCPNFPIAIGLSATSVSTSVANLVQDGLFAANEVNYTAMNVGAFIMTEHHPIWPGSQQGTLEQVGETLEGE